MSDLIFARSPFHLKQTSVADPPPPAYECYETNDYSRYSVLSGFSVNAAGAIQNGTIVDKATGATLTQTAITGINGESSFPVVYIATPVTLRVTFNIPSGYSTSAHTCTVDATQAAGTPTCQNVKLVDFSQGTSGGSVGLNIVYTNCSDVSTSLLVNVDNQGVTIQVKYPATTYLSWHYTTSSGNAVLYWVYNVTQNYIDSNTTNA